MKTTTLSARLQAFLHRAADSLVDEGNHHAKGQDRKGSTSGRRSRAQRRDFYYYMQIQDATTKEIVGHLADISSGGFKLDSRKPVPVNQDVRFMINLPSEIANKPYLVFGARSRWCEIDPLDPCGFNVGYQLTNILAEDLEIMNRMMERYGRDCRKRNIDLRRSYKW